MPSKAKPISSVTAAEALPHGCELRCPGCSHRGFSAEESESRKLDWLARALELWSDRIVPVVGERGAARLGYREKTCLRAEWDGSRWKLGLRVRLESAGPKPLYEVVDIPECPVHSRRLREWMGVLSRELPRDLPLAFVIVSGTLVTLVLKSAVAPSVDLSPVWTKLETAGVTGIFLNLNPSAGERVTTSKGWMRVRGEETARNEFGYYGPDSFQQLIPRLYFQALSEAGEFLRPGHGDFVLDLCSGSGISLRRWKQAGARALGVELGAESVRCAELNAGAGSCLRGRASDRIPQLQAAVNDFAGGRVLCFANPPRLGLETEVVAWLGERVRPERIAYLSCSAGTLARDLSVLTKAGYSLRRITPYDFFPQTHHIETLALLEKT